MQYQGQITKKRTKIPVIGLVIISIITIAAAGGNILYKKTIPQVKATKIRSGVLEASIDAIGEVKYNDVISGKSGSGTNPEGWRTSAVISHGEWKIKNIQVSAGDTVSQGSVLAEIDMEDAQIALKKKEYEIKKLELELERIQNAGNHRDDIRIYDNEAAQAQIEFKNKEEDYKNLKELASIGGVSEKELKDAKAAMEKALIAYQNKIKQAAQKRSESVKDLRDSELQAKESDTEIQLKKLDLESMKQNFPKDGQIKSDMAGIIKSVNIQSGSLVNNGKVLFEIVDGVSKDSEEIIPGYYVEIKMDANRGEILKKGDPVRIEIRQPNELKLLEKVIKVKELQEGKYIVTCSLKNEDNKIRAGQQVRVFVEKSGASHDKIVPKNSVTITGDRQGYVYVAEKQVGFLGNFGYVHKVDVTINEMNELECAVEGNIDYDDMIITFLSRPLAEGTKVRF